jgi:hypothetical protein
VKGEIFMKDTKNIITLKSAKPFHLVFLVKAFKEDYPTAEVRARSKFVKNGVLYFQTTLRY